MAGEPEKLLKEFEQELCEKYDIYPVDGCTGIAPTGESYITYTCQGPKEEGVAGDNWGHTPLDAVQKYINALFFILPDMRPRLRIYWRSRPEIVKDPDGEYDIWSRFLISDKRYFMGA